MKRSSLLLAVGSCCLFVLCGPTQAAQPDPKAPGPIIVGASVSEHPLLPILRWAEKERPNIEKIEDYTAILTKQENIDGELQGIQVMEIKVRHRPLSFYTKFRYPKKVNGQEAIYIDGRNDGKLIAHGAGPERTFGTQRLPPEGGLAMRHQKYPITELGVLRLVDRLLEVGRKDVQFGECDVKYTEGVKVNQHECILVEVIHPVPRKNFIFHVARIFIDKRHNLPIRYDSYSWPEEEGAKPPLIESYTYDELKINTGLTDLDFDHSNPAYGFRAAERN